MLYVARIELIDPSDLTQTPYRTLKAERYGRATRLNPG